MHIYQYKDSCREMHRTLCTLLHKSMTTAYEHNSANKIECIQLPWPGTCCCELQNIIKPDSIVLGECNIPVSLK